MAGFPTIREDLDTRIHTNTECHVNMKMAMYKPGKKAWNQFSLTALRKNKSCRHLDLRLLSFWNWDNGSLV